MLTGMHNALGKGQGMGLSPLLPPPRKREDKHPLGGVRQWGVLPFRSGGRCFGCWPLACFPLKTVFHGLSASLVLVAGCCGGATSGGLVLSPPWGGVDNREGEPPEGWGNPGGVPRPWPLSAVEFSTTVVKSTALKIYIS